MLPNVLDSMVPSGYWNKARDVQFAAFANAWRTQPCPIEGTSVCYNIIQMHNNVLWHSQYSMEHCNIEMQKEFSPPPKYVTPYWEVKNIRFRSLNQHLPELWFQWLQILWSWFVVAIILKLLMLKFGSWTIPHSWTCPHSPHLPSLVSL